MKTIYFFFLMAISFIIQNNVAAQTNIFPNNGAVGIGTTSPDASSSLEIKSTKKGVLISRMTKTQRDAIKSPATGLLIYQTNSAPGFYYYDGSAWKAIITSKANLTLSNLDAPTSINVNLLPDSNNLRNLGSTSKGWRNVYAKGAYYLNGKKFISNSGASNTFIGDSAGNSITTGSGNTANGFDALFSNTTGLSNTASGAAALYSNTTGYYNTANGVAALYSNTTGHENTATGISALYSNVTGYYNTANGTDALEHNLTGIDNTANGAFALTNNTTGSSNTANGFNTLLDNTTGYENTANGVYALSNNTTGYYNTANGAGALLANNTGYENSANGYNALHYNTTGNHNTANGTFALWYNNAGSYNVANGTNALHRNTTGSENVATGFDAMYYNTAGAYNTAVGSTALYGTTASQYNTAVGYRAGLNYDNGYNNVFLGANTDVDGAGYYNIIAIGQGTVCTASSQVTMGNSATGEYRAYANWSNISDGRYKKNLKEDVPGLKFINKLKPVTYTLDATGIDNFLHKDISPDKQPGSEAKAVQDKALKEKEKIRYTGFIAQDVEKSAKEIGYDFSGVDAAKNSKDLYGLRYAEFVVPLVKAVQELSRENDSLKFEIGNLESEVESIKVMIFSNQSTVNKQQSTAISSALLSQNVPNPFSNSTTISYTLSQNYSSAKIVITDNKGVTLKEISLHSKGKGNVSIDASTLSSGTYQYSLIVDGKMLITKQMILTK